MPAGGRGGRGAGFSFSTESLGFGRGDILPSAVLTPPPTFPPLSNKPVKMDQDNEHILTRSRDLRNYFRSSQFYLKAGNSSQADLDVDWSNFPEELRPQFGSKKKKMKSSAKANLVSKRSNIDIQTTLSALEEKENSNKEDNDDKQEVKDDSEEEEEKKSDIESDVDEPDEEMDGGTDYANNYFDNGEDYIDDEDDNLDEGGIY